MLVDLDGGLRLPSSFCAASTFLQKSWPKQKLHQPETQTNQFSNLKNKAKVILWPIRHYGSNRKSQTDASDTIGQAVQIPMLAFICIGSLYEFEHDLFNEDAVLFGKPFN